MCLVVGLTVYTDFLKHLPKNMALLAEKLWRIFFCQTPFPAILRRKKKKKRNGSGRTTKNYFKSFFFVNGTASTLLKGTAIKKNNFFLRLLNSLSIKRVVFKLVTKKISNIIYNNHHLSYIKNYVNIFSRKNN